ncbi:MAG: hypothetical protein A3G87_03795 [Omnitrophica bacterium RIFCSPLOWO2_12_FULL_50_11]|nr:MAG: hypothetical protein A3G87_03795 [Omnitrophica bacterium RIFCSPLOWO2_12_FULL_50_11]
MANQIFTFPKDFLWGSATSSHQVEGGNSNNDWWDWEQSGRVKEKSGAACDHWNRFREDFRLARSLGHNAHRFSLEWSRIEPEEGQFSKEALAHYREVIESLASNDLEPIVTLHHFTLPRWLSKQGGWLSSRTPELFARYVRTVTEAIGEGVRYWMTLNEPVVYAFKSYFLGEWPPGDKSFRAAIQVLANLLRGHVAAYEGITDVSRKLRRKPVQTGIAHYVAALTPCAEHSFKDKLATQLRHLALNRLFVNALVRGRVIYPGFFSIRLARAKTLDFIGLDYYTRDFVHYRGFGIPQIFGDLCSLQHHREVGPRNFLSWEIFPRGIYLLVKEFSRYGLPILISENGLCTQEDRERTEFITDHVRGLARAMREGACVIGYLYWSLLDNFEWADGFSPRFGLVEVDYSTQARRVRESAKMLADICRSGTITLKHQGPA